MSSSRAVEKEGGAEEGGVGLGENEPIRRTERRRAAEGGGRATEGGRSGGGRRRAEAERAAEGGAEEGGVEAEVEAEAVFMAENWSRASPGLGSIAPAGWRRMSRFGSKSCKLKEKRPLVPIRAANRD